jgi:HD-like signal output (HDOD) protein
MALVRVEQTVLGANHAQIGARLLERWKLPAEVVAAVRCHHRPAAAEEHIRLAATVSLANALARNLGTTVKDMPSTMAEADEASRILQLKPEDLTGIVEDALRELERIKSLLGIKG